MDNVIKIKTSQTDNWIEACLEMNKNIHVAVYEHYKRESTYIVTTKGIQELFELGAAFGYHAALTGGHPYPKPSRKVKPPRGKGNE